MYRWNPDDELRELERHYGATGDIEILNKINAILSRRGEPLIFSREQVLEREWRELDSDLFQFVSNIWSTHDIPDAIYRNRMNEVGLSPDRDRDYDRPEAAEIREEVDEIRERWDELTKRRNEAFQKYFDHITGRGRTSRRHYR